MIASEDATLSEEVQETLRIGIIIAAALLLVGIGLALVGGTADILAPPSRISVASLPGRIVVGNGQAFILLGVLVLVFTPIGRVLVSFAHFTHRREYSFSLITAFVLAVLATSVWIGLSP
ncbi:MAG: DUF1634 domain-containing protein [Thermoplasmata archaeon]|nr:DUF1634 domain-containing protein [Thermoplasmata archaeon]MCI4359403.1 DUF1634 domain-containing protein [Thermoplasmata archaeon]